MTDQQPISSGPVLGSAFQESSPLPTSGSTTGGFTDKDTDAKSSKRRFWGLGKKKEDEKAKQRTVSDQTDESPQASTKQSDMRPASPLVGVAGIPTFTKNAPHPYSPTSPARNLHSASPAPPSPASSQIFERHVQEDALAIREQAPIPGHITTENHIPPVLDASSEAITNEQLNPDQVEIVMHSAHQPASVTVTGAPASDTGGFSSLDDPSTIPESEDGASTYGSLDSTDVRRLSFISFADVVHAEHTHDGGSITTGMISPVTSHNRSPSPIRSPLYSQGLGGSPTLSDSVSSKGFETSPSRMGKNLKSPLQGHSPPSTGELTIETMRQALRKTGSGDLSGARSAPLSATSDTEMHLDPLHK